jgi:hypothetical protein
MYNNQQIIEHNIYRLVMENQDSLLMKVLNTPNMGTMLMENRQNRPNKNEILSAVGSSLIMNEDFIKSNYRSLSNPNVSTLELKSIENTINEEMLNEFLGWIWKVGKKGGKWILDKLKDTLRPGKKTPGPNPSPTAPGPTPTPRPRRPSRDIPMPWDVDGVSHPPGAAPGWGPYDHRPLPGENIPGLSGPDLPNLPESYASIKNLNEFLYKLKLNIKTLNEQNQQFSLNENMINFLLELKNQTITTNNLLEQVLNSIQINKINHRL